MILEGFNHQSDGGKKKKKKESENHHISIIGFYYIGTNIKG
jgi:hypothetical protein